MMADRFEMISVIDYEAQIKEQKYTISEIAEKEGMFFLF